MILRFESTALRKAAGKPTSGRRAGGACVSGDNGGTRVVEILTNDLLHTSLFVAVCIFFADHFEGSCSALVRLKNDSPEPSSLETK